MDQDLKSFQFVNNGLFYFIDLSGIDHKYYGTFTCFRQFLANMLKRNLSTGEERWGGI